jgi:uncharacterized protein (TIGR02058 family)
MGKFIVEFGLGMDLHGQDVSKAARKAVKDAISHSCLCGLGEVLHLDIDRDVKINATVAVSRPEEVDIPSVEACFPVGQATVHVQQGGLNVPGAYLPRFGDRDESIEVAVAAIMVEVPDRP